MPCKDWKTCRWYTQGTCFICERHEDEPERDKGACSQDNHGRLEDNTDNTDYRAVAMKNARRVLQKTISGELVGTWESMAQIKRELGYSAGNISMCCSGKYKKPLYGFIWEYATGGDWA